MKSLLIVLFSFLSVFGYSQTNLIVFDGNSLVDGTGSSTGVHGASTNFSGMDFPAQLSRLLGSAGFTYYNFGVAGQNTSNMTSDAATQIDPLYNAANSINILVGWEITNDITLDGQTSQQAYTLYKNYFLARKAKGFKNVVLTVLPRFRAFGNSNQAQFNASRDSINTLIRAEYKTYAEALADVGDLPIVLTDQIHTDDTGYAIVAATVADAIRPLLSFKKLGRKAIVQ